MGRDAFGSAQKHKDDCFLRMHAVLGLIEDDGLWTVQNCVGDFGPAMGGEAVHEGG